MAFCGAHSAGTDTASAVTAIPVNSIKSCSKRPRWAEIVRFSSLSRV
jgi:hypothetical protein